MRERLDASPRLDGATRRELLLATAGLVVAVAILLHKQVLNWYTVPDLGDPLFSMWRIGWVAHKIVADPRHLFDANTFHPEPLTLTYSDSMLLPALTGAPFLWLGVPLAVVYTLLLLGAIVVSGMATFMFARALGLSALPSAISALLFAFCQYRLDHYSHLELQMTMWMPLTLLAALRLLATGRRRYFIYLMLAAGAQWYSSMYYGVFLTIYAGVFIGVLALVWRPGLWRSAAAAAALICGVVLALPLARVYQASEGDRGTRAAFAVKHYSAVPLDYLQPNRRSVYGEWTVGKQRVSERELFPHFTPIVLAAVGAWPPLNTTRLALIVSGLVAFDGSLGFNGTWYRAAYENLHPLKSMRVPARLAVLVHFTLAILSGFGAARLLDLTRTRKQRHVVSAAITLIVLLESFPTLKLTPVWKRPPRLYSTLGPRSGAVLFEYPVHLHQNFAYIYLSTWHWTKMVNGYSGFIPRSFKELTDSTENFPLDGTVDYLKSRGVTHVTIHCAFWTKEACALTLDRIERDPRFSLAMLTRWQGSPAHLYQLR